MTLCSRTRCDISSLQPWIAARTGAWVRTSTCFLLVLFTKKAEPVQGECTGCGRCLGAQLLINICTAVNIWGMLL